jgi:hypothetical protein
MLDFKKPSESSPGLSRTPPESASHIGMEEKNSL